MLTGRIAGSVMWRKVCQRVAPSTWAASSDLLVLAFERGQQDDEHERRPLPDVADHHGVAGQPRVGHPGEVRQTEQLGTRGWNGPLPVSVSMRNM